MENSFFNNSIIKNNFQNNNDASKLVEAAISEVKKDGTLENVKGYLKSFNAGCS